MRLYEKFKYTSEEVDIRLISFIYKVVSFELLNVEDFFILNLSLFANGTPRLAHKDFIESVSLFTFKKLLERNLKIDIKITS